MMFVNPMPTAIIDPVGHLELIIIIDGHLQGPRTGRTKFGEDEVGIPSNFLSDLPAAMA